MSIGARIVGRRKQLGWTQRELSRRSGLSPAYLCDLERDKRGVGVESLGSIAAALGVTMGYLCEPDAPPQEGASVIPGRLARLAMGVSMTYRDADLIYRLAVTAKGANLDCEAFDWLKFHEALKPFLA